MNPAPLDLAVTFGVALLAALTLTPVVRSVARRTGMIDRPNSRSLHSEGVPRGGGLAVLAAAATGLIAGGLGRLEPDEWALLLGVVALALTGLADDRFGLCSISGSRADTQYDPARGVGPEVRNRDPVPARLRGADPQEARR